MFDFTGDEPDRCLISEVSQFLGVFSWFKKMKISFLLQMYQIRFLFLLYICSCLGAFSVWIMCPLVFWLFGFCLAVSCHWCGTGCVASFSPLPPRTNMSQFLGVADRPPHSSPTISTLTHLHLYLDFTCIKQTNFIQDIRRFPLFIVHSLETFDFLICSAPLNLSGPFWLIYSSTQTFWIKWLLNTTLMVHVCLNGAIETLTHCFYVVIEGGATKGMYHTCSNVGTRAEPMTHSG